jgi:ATP-binding cassette, subfamily B, multidrug efflux pump
MGAVLQATPPLPNGPCDTTFAPVNAPAAAVPTKIAPSTFSLWAYSLRHKGQFSLGALFLLITTSVAMQIPRLTQRAIDAIQHGDRDGIIRALWWIAGTATAAMLTRVASRIYIFYAGRDIEYEIRTELFARLLRHPPRFFTDNSTGDVLNKSISDLQNIRALLGVGFLNVVNTPIVFVIALVSMAQMSGPLTVYALLPFPVMMFAMSRIARQMYTHTRTGQEALDKIASHVQENLAGMPVIQGFSRELTEIERFKGEAQSYFEAQRRAAKAQAAMIPVMGIMSTLGLGISLFAGGQMVIDGTLTLGQFVAFNEYLTMLSWPMLALGWVMALWQRGMASVERVRDLYNREPEITDDGVEPVGATDIGVPGLIEFRGLTYRYPAPAIATVKADDAGKPPPDRGVRDVNLTIRPGSTVVLIGKAGSGKTTLINLLTRMIDTPPGMVFVGGVDVTRWPLTRLRAALRVAPQTAFLFSRSVNDNIAFAPTPLTGAEIESAADDAAIGETIRELPKGYQTLVGERGITLSGGQRQRVAIARSLATNPSVIVLDDSLSALDSETEAQVLLNLRRRLASVTAIIVSHRVSTARGADQIVVMDEGRVVETGTFDSLVAAGGVFAKMVERQRLADALARLTAAPTAQHIQKAVQL